MKISELERMIDLLTYHIYKRKEGFELDHLEIDDLEVVLRCLKTYNSL